MKKLASSVVLVGSSALAASAQAAGLDLTAITGAFSATDIITGVMAIAGTLATVAVAIKAAKTVLGMLRGRA